MPLRLIFMGTPEFSVPTLSAIAASRHEVVAVYTRAPKPAGRGMALAPSPVARLAQDLGMPILTPKTLRRDDVQATFRAHRADAAVVVAFGLILPQPILTAVPLGSLNLHASLLPRWRGAAPINRAIMAGDTETGVVVMKMDEGLDTGPVAMAARVAIGADMTAGELHDALAPIGAEFMVRALAALEHGALTWTPQPETGITYAAKIDKAETRINWSWDGRRVHDHCRGLSPFPGAWFAIDGDTRVKALRTMRVQGSGPIGTVLDDHLTVACGEGAVRLLEVQRAGRQPMKTEEFLRGTPIAPGTRLP